MSRHGYVDDCDLDPLKMGRWTGAVLRALRGKRGQAFLREMLAALDAMPDKRLIPSALIDEEGEVCAMGCVLKARGVTPEKLPDADCPEDVADLTGVAESMVREIAYRNDEGGPYAETPEHRWLRMRRWAEKQIQATTEEPVSAASERGEGKANG